MQDSIDKLRLDLEVLTAENKLLKEKLFKQAKEVEHARALEIRYKALIENTGNLARIGSWEYTIASQKLYWSNEIYNIHELDRSFDLNVTSAIHLFVEEHRPIIIAAFENALKLHQSYDLVLQIVTSKGRRKWVRALGQVLDKNGTVEKVFGTLQDIDLENNVRIKLDKIVTLGNKLISDKQQIDYNLIARSLCEISEASFVVLNLRKGLLFSTDENFVASDGTIDSNVSSNFSELIGRMPWKNLDIEHPVLGKKWFHRFDLFSDFSSFVSDEEAFCNFLKQFDIGLVYFIPLLNGDKVLGHFMLFFKPNDELRYPGTVEIFTNQMANVLSQNELHKAIQFSERKYRKLIENSSDITAIVSEQGRFTYISPNILQIFGWNPKDLINHRFCDYARNDGFEIECDSLIDWIEQKGQFATGEFLFQKKAGTFASVRLTGVSLVNDPDIQGILINFSDISTQKKAEEKSHKLELAIENNPLSIVITNSQGIVEYVNASFTAISGYTLEDILGKKTSILKSGLTPIEVYHEMWSTILNGKEWKGEMQNKRKNGELFWETISINSIKNKKGIITHFVAVKEDITKHRELALELENRNRALLQADIEKNKFFSIIAHDLRGPFNAFLGLTEFMHDELPDMEIADAQKIAADLNRTAHNIYELLNNLLTWSRIKMGTMAFEPQPVCLLQLINNSIQFVSDAFIQKGISLNVTIDGHLNVIADTNMISSVIHNLISNALKFTNEGGLIKIGASEIPNGFLCIEIHDNGIGMEAKILENLFKIDSKINRPGTNNEPSVGLGLLLCQEFIEKHGGKIWATSQVGQGSQFYFTLYRAEK
jgi:PAS domain S-box-containing protein